MIRVRGYAERQCDQWVAVCLDFTLAAQADTLEEVRSKLDAQIEDYLYDALQGDARAHAYQLLQRRAPLYFWLKYWSIWSRLRLPTFSPRLQLGCRDESRVLVWHR